MARCISSGWGLGTELRNTSREIVGIIIQANSARDKQPDLLRLRVRTAQTVIPMGDGVDHRLAQRLAVVQRPVFPPKPQFPRRLSDISL